MQKDIKKIACLLSVSIVVFCGFHVYTKGHRDEAPPGDDMIMINTESNIGEGFLVFNEEIYYKQPSMCIIPEVKTSNPAFKVEEPVMYKDFVDDHTFKGHVDVDTGYGIAAGTEVFSHPRREDVLLTENDYHPFGYSIYIKGTTKQEFDISDLYNMVPDHPVCHIYDVELNELASGTMDSISETEYTETQDALQEALLVIQTDELGIEYFGYWRNGEFWTQEEDDTFLIQLEGES